MHCGLRLLTVLTSEAPRMDMLIVALAPFALGFGVGYGVREWKSRVRRRRYSGGL
jgi:hypothetical protein